MKLHAKIALRYLFASRGASLIITLMSFFGIYLGVLALLLTLGVFTGFQDELKEKILSRTPHIVITLYPDQKLPRIEKTLGELSEVKLRIHSKLYSAFISNGRTIQSVSVQSVDFNDEDFRLFIEPFLEGELRELVVGKGIARMLGLEVGDEVKLVSPFGIRTPTGVLPRVGSFTVGGVFSTGSYEKDFAFVYMEKQKAEKFFKNDYSVNLTEVYLKDPYRAQEVKQKLISTLGEEVLIRSWIDLNKALFNALELEKLGLFFILLLMVLVASFNITSLLFVKVKERVRDIAVFKTFGMRQRDILLIFLLVGMSISVVGMIAGTLSAYALSYFINEYKLIRVSEEVYMMSYIPVHIKLKDVLMVLVGTLLLSFLSSFVPSLRASREKVIEVLRKE
ncbi:MAG: ABC transporter permease [Aquificae bacterium]|nr:ABC transporter permease [Aquificota bacterium]